MSNLVRTNLLVSLIYLISLWIVIPLDSWSNLAYIDVFIWLILSQIFLITGALAGVLVGILAKFYKHKIALSFASVIIPLVWNLLFALPIMFHQVFIPWYMLLVLIVMHFFVTYRALEKEFSSVRIQRVKEVDNREYIVVKKGSKGLYETR